MFYDFYSKDLSNLHQKLEFETLIRTKGTAEASCAREPTLCCYGQKYDPFLIKFVKCFAAGDDCIIHQTSPIPKLEQQTCRAR